jgi:zinc D-Ala-D-Ala carboxypeptidase
MKYFNYSEFDSPDVVGSGKLMDKDFLNKLDELREKFDKPIKINSGYRTENHNANVGGTPSSSHIKGLAVDIACNNSKDRFAIIDICLDLGINRIGVAGTFIHIDVDPDKSPNVLWTY